MIIYTIGISRRSFDGFIGILKGYGISLLVDVRDSPISRWVSWSNKGNLIKVMPDHGIKYVYFGRELGGKKDNSGNYDVSVFEAYAQTGDYERALGRLESIASGSRAAITCSEGSPERCHRRVIAQSLRDRGFEVIHVIDKGRTWRQGPKQLSLEMR